MLDSSAGLLLVSALLLIMLLFLGLDLFRVRQRLRRFEQDLTQVRAMAPQVGRAEAQEASLNRLMVELTRLTERLQTARDVRLIPQVLVHLLQRTFEAEQVLVLFTRRGRPSDTTPELVVVATSSGAAERAMNESIPFGEGELGLVAQLQEAMDHQDFELRAVPRHAAVPGMRSFRTDLASPMVVGGETFGVVGLSGLGRHFKNEKGMLTLVAQTAGFGLQSALSYLELKNRADIDGLTRILNRQALTERLGELIFDAERSGRNVGVFMFDVDNFKHYNDRNGHAAGDRVLKEICDVVTESIRSEDVFGRIGGEEFVVVTPHQSVASTYGLAEKLRRAVEATDFEHGADQPLGRVTVSGGVAVFPGHARNSAELLRHADDALYRAKAAGRNRVEIAVPQASPSR